MCVSQCLPVCVCCLSLCVCDLIFIFIEFTLDSAESPAQRGREKAHEGAASPAASAAAALSSSSVFT